MASAIQLNAANSIINGQGLNVSVNLLSQIATFQNQAPIRYIANLFATASTVDANISSNLTTILANLGQGVTNGTQWLIDLYPSNITPTCSGSIYYYEYEKTPIFEVEAGTGNLIITGYNESPVTSTASFSHTLTNQASMPFVYGMREFANVYSAASGYASSVFDTVSSIYLLKGKTYSQLGIGYTGPVDLATNGIGTQTSLLSSIVSNFGTMYDVTNIDKLGDPYVFGQNLLNQGLGKYGAWDVALTNVGLNISNLPAIPINSNVTTIGTTTVTVQSLVGPVDYELSDSTTVTTTVTGSSPAVVISIYANVVSTDLTAISTATQVKTPTVLTSLSEYLLLEKIVNAQTYSQLKSLGVNNLSELGQLLQKKVGQGYYKSWADLATFLESVNVPTLVDTVATANTLALADATANGLLTKYGTGTGPFNNPVTSDYLGAAAGIPHTALLNTINNNYAAAQPPTLLPAVRALDSAVTTYATTEIVYLDGNIMTGPDPAPVINAVAAVNLSLNSSIASLAFIDAESSYYASLNHISNEVSNCVKAGVVFNNPTTTSVDNFAMSIGVTATGTDMPFFANLITNDRAGDTIRLAVSEATNTTKFMTKGIVTTNDPNPLGIVTRAAQQNVPVSTIIAQNFGGNSAISV